MKTPEKCSKLSSATHGSGSYNFYAIHTQYIPSVTPNFRVTLSLCHKTSLRVKSFIENKFDLRENKLVGGTQFQIIGFAEDSF